MLAKHKGNHLASASRKMLSSMKPATRTGLKFGDEYLSQEGLNSRKGEPMEGLFKGLEGWQDEIDRHVVMHLHADTKLVLYGEKQLGWASATAHAGDQICLIPGMPCPFLIRQCEGGHRLVGACYAPGYMKGEGNDEEQDPTQDIKLH